MKFSDTTSATAAHTSPPTVGETSTSPSARSTRSPPNSASPRHPLTRCTSPPCDRSRDDPTVVCVTRKPSGTNTEGLSNWLGSGQQDLNPAWPSTCCPILLRSDRPKELGAKLLRLS